MRAVVPCYRFFVPIFNKPFNIYGKPHLAFAQAEIQFCIHNLIGNTERGQFREFHIAFGLTVAVNIAHIKAAHIVRAGCFIAFIRILGRYECRLNIFCALLCFKHRVNRNGIFPALLIQPSFIKRCFNREGVVFAFNQRKRYPRRSIALRVFHKRRS